MNVCVCLTGHTGLDREGHFARRSQRQKHGSRLIFVRQSVLLIVVPNNAELSTKSSSSLSYLFEKNNYGYCVKPEKNLVAMVA